jgi:hypothetical protein
MAAMQCEVPKNETSEAEFVLALGFPFVANTEPETCSKWDVYCPDSRPGNGPKDAHFVV